MYGRRRPPRPTPAIPRMQPSRLTLKALWRLYNAAQDLLKNGQTADAAEHFHRIAAARIRRTKGEKTPTTQEVENPLVTRARLGLCYCYGARWWSWKMC
jgi:hypothetical protein